MKRCIYVSVILAGLAATGCQTDQQIAKQEAQKRWQVARAKIVCGVGQECFKNGDLDRAAGSAQEALSMDPAYLPAQILLAKVMIEKGQYAQAGTQLRQAEQLDPKSGEVQFLLGVSLEKRRLFPEALKCYEQARIAEPDNNAYLTASAEVLIQTGSAAQALELVEGRLARTESDPVLLGLAGELCLLTDQPGRAAEYFGRCLDQNPKSLTLRESMARACFQAGKFADALEHLQRLADQPQYREKAQWLYVMMGDCHMGLKKYGLAKSDFEMATVIDGSDARAWCRLSTAALALGDTTRATLAARQALAGGENPQAALVLGAAMLKEGQPAKAAELLAPYVQKYPDDSALRTLLGRSYQLSGQPEKAAACYQQALKVDPANKLARTLLAGAEGK